MDRATRTTSTIAHEIAAMPAQVAAAVKMLGEGATVPFVARYRKEPTGGLDDVVLERNRSNLSHAGSSWLRPPT